MSTPAQNSASTPQVLEALEELRPELLAFVRSRVRTKAEADDIVQVALLRAIERADTLNDPSKLRGWLYTIARRALIDQSRKSGREFLTDHGELPENSLAENPRPLDAEHPCACAMDLTNTLAPGQANLIRLVDVEEHSLEEVAAQISSSKNAATVRLHRARQNLKDKLREHCGVTDARSASRCSCDTRTCESGRRRA